MPDRRELSRRDPLKTAALAVTLWQSLEAEPTTEEIIRNLPIRHPLLWVE